MGRAVPCDVMRRGGGNRAYGVTRGMKDVHGRPRAGSGNYRIEGVHLPGSEARMADAYGRLRTICIWRLSFSVGVGLPWDGPWGCLSALSMLPTLPCPVLSCPALSCSVLSCPVLSCLALSCPVPSRPVLSCPVLSCPVLFCPVLPVMPMLSIRLSAVSRSVSRVQPGPHGPPAGRGRELLYFPCRAISTVT